MNRPLAALALAIPLALPFALGACKDEADTTGAASGEILPGSISDAMLPEDRVTSQPPLDPRTMRTGPAAEADDDATAAPPAAATEAAPAEPAATTAP
jgi:hypothetical protein